MKGIKDFFHDSNDILLAVIITLLAVGVIGWRIMVILDYPDKVAAEQAKTEQVQQDADGTSDADADADADAETSTDSENAEDSSTAESSSESTDGN